MIKANKTTLNKVLKGTTVIVAERFITNSFWLITDDHPVWPAMQRHVIGIAAGFGVLPSEDHFLQWREQDSRHESGGWQSYPNVDLPNVEALYKRNTAHVGVKPIELFYRITPKGAKPTKVMAQLVNVDGKVSDETMVNPEYELLFQGLHLTVAHDKRLSPFHIRKSDDSVVGLIMPVKTPSEYGFTVS